MRDALRSVRGAFDLPTTLALIATGCLAVAASYVHPAGPFAVVGVLSLIGAVLAARQRPGVEAETSEALRLPGPQPVFKDDAA